MTRALVIYGDPALGGALAAGVTTRELDIARAELRKMQARDGVRRYGDTRRWQRTQKRLARKYSTRPTGRARGAILGAWALTWLWVLGWYEYLSAWNRSAG